MKNYIESNGMAVKQFAVEKASKFSFYHLRHIFENTCPVFLWSPVGQGDWVAMVTEVA